MSASRRFVALALAVPLLASIGRVAAAEGEETPPPAAAPQQLFAQQDRRKLMKIDLPRTWKAVPGENIDPKALLSMHGFLG
jgi:hypothetical protein